MAKPTDDIGEPTITLPTDEGRADKRFYTRLGAVLLLAALGYVVWRIVTPLWQPLAWALLLGSLLAPLNLRLANRLGGRTRLASAITLLLTVLLFILPVVAIAGAVAAQAAQLLRKLEPQMQGMTQQSLSLDLAAPAVARKAAGLDRRQHDDLARPAAGLAARGLAAPAAVADVVRRHVRHGGARHGGELHADAVRAVLRAARRPGAGAESGADAADRRPAPRTPVAAPHRRHARGVPRHRPHRDRAGHAGRHRLLDRRAAVAAGVRRDRRAGGTDPDWSAPGWSGRRARCSSPPRATTVTPSSSPPGVRSWSAWWTISCARC